MDALTGPAIFPTGSRDVLTRLHHGPWGSIESFIYSLPHWRSQLTEYAGMQRTHETHYELTRPCKPNKPNRPNPEHPNG